MEIGFFAAHVQITPLSLVLEAFLEFFPQLSSTVLSLLFLLKSSFLTPVDFFVVPVFLLKHESVSFFLALILLFALALRLSLLLAA